MKNCVPLFPLLALLATGCGSDIPNFPDTAAVTGKVTQGGKPVDGATVTFVPRSSGEGSHAASSVTGADGSYTLFTFFSAAANEEGAVPGDYNVTVTKAPPPDPNAVAAHGEDYVEPAEQTGPTNLLPKQYASASSTPLQVKVEPEKDNVIPLELK